MISEVHNMDCLEYMRTLPDKCFNLAIADPPYGGAVNDKPENTPPTDECYNRFGGRFDRYKSWRDVGNEVWKKIVAWDTAPSEEFFNELFRVSRHQIIWGGNYFTLPPTRCFVVWRKLTISESFTMAEYAWTSFNGNAKVFECAPQGNKSDIRFHPTQKPVELYAWLLQRYAKQGDKIFDPMMGSQSSRIAAHKLGFDYVGCELDEEYFAKGCERYDRECNGITVADDGKRYQQTSLF